MLDVYWQESNANIIFAYLKKQYKYFKKNCWPACAINAMVGMILLVT